MIILVNQEKLTKTERVKLYVTLSNYIFHKTKYIRGKFTLEQLRFGNIPMLPILRMKTILFACKMILEDKKE